MSPAALALPPEFIAQLPEESLAIYAARGTTSEGGKRATATLQIASVAIDQARSLGLLSNVDLDVRAWLDTAAALVDVVPHHHAVVLFDIRARSRGASSHKLSSLSAALVVATGENQAAIERRIQHLLTMYTNSEASTLTPPSKTGQPYTLRDRRLPDWAVLQFGSVGKYFVVSIGDRAFARTADAIGGSSPGLGGDPWLEKAFVAAGGRAADHILLCRFDRVRRRLDDRLAAKVDAVMSSLRLPGIERGLWTLGQAGRAVEMDGYVRRAGQDEHLAIAGRRVRERYADVHIPAQATRYTIVDCNPQSVVRGVAEAYLATRSPAAQAESRAFWSKLEQESGVSFADDILARCGRCVVIHDYPAAAVDLPVARTILVKINHQPQAIRSAVNRLMTTLAGWLEPDSSVRLHHDDDGVWYVQAGIVGPGVIVTDEWLIVSFSPHAVRQNVAVLASR